MGDRTDESIGLERAADGGAGSAVRLYQQLVIGSAGAFPLLRHELLVSWGALLPGALGFGFRRLLWRGSLFHHAGRNLVWGRNITLWHAAKMHIGDRVAIDDDCHLDARGCAPGAFSIGDGALVGRGCIISGKDGPLSIGARTSIGAGCVMYASTRLEIGADTMLAALCYVGGGRYATRGRVDVPIAEQPEPRLGVIIEEDCWLGAGVTVIDGVRIGRGSIVAAGAVVTRDVASHSIVAGVPARCIGSRIAAGQPREVSN